MVGGTPLCSPSSPLFLYPSFSSHSSLSLQLLDLISSPVIIIALVLNTLFNSLTFIEMICSAFHTLVSVFEQAYLI